MFTFHHILGTNLTEVKKDGHTAITLSRAHNVFANDKNVYITIHSRLLDLEEAEHKFPLYEIDFAKCQPSIAAIDLETQLQLLHLTFFGEHGGIISKKSEEAQAGKFVSELGVITEYGSPTDRVSFTDFRVSNRMPVNSGFTVYCKSSETKALFSNSVYNQVYGEYVPNKLLKIEYYRNQFGAGEYLVFPVQEIPIAKQIIFHNDRQEWPGLAEPAYVSGTMVSIAQVLGEDGTPLPNYEVIMEVKVGDNWEALPTRRASIFQPYMVLPFIDELETFFDNPQEITEARLAYRFFDGIGKYRWKRTKTAPFVPLKRLDDANYLDLSNFIVRKGTLDVSMDYSAIIHSPVDEQLFVAMGDAHNQFVHGEEYVLLLSLRSSLDTIRVQVSGGGYFEGGKLYQEGVPSDHLKQFVLHKKVVLPDTQAEGKIEILAEEASEDDFIHFRVMVAQTV